MALKGTPHGRFIRAIEHRDLFGAEELQALPPGLQLDGEIYAPRS